jgi:hypothetical protein
LIKLIRQQQQQQQQNSGLAVHEYIRRGEGGDEANPQSRGSNGRVQSHKKTAEAEKYVPFLAAFSLRQSSALLVRRRNSQKATSPHYFLDFRNVLLCQFFGLIITMPLPNIL